MNDCGLLIVIIMYSNLPSKSINVDQRQNTYRKKLMDIISIILFLFMYLLGTEEDRKITTVHQQYQEN